MADDRQLADIWRHQYTGPLFRKYAGTEQLPEVSIGYLARQSRLAVDFCQKMMAPLGLKHYAVNTPLNLPSGEIGVMHTNVIAGFGGTPIVTTRVELSRKRRKEEERELPGLFVWSKEVEIDGEMVLKGYCLEPNPAIRVDGTLLGEEGTWRLYELPEPPPTTTGFIHYTLPTNYGVTTLTSPSIDDYSIFTLFGEGSRFLRSFTEEEEEEGLVYAYTANGLTNVTPDYVVFDYENYYLDGSYFESTFDTFLFKRTEVISNTVVGEEKTTFDFDPEGSVTSTVYQMDEDWIYIRNEYDTNAWPITLTTRKQRPGTTWGGGGSLETLEQAWKYVSSPFRFGYNYGYMSPSWGEKYKVGDAFNEPNFRFPNNFWGGDYYDDWRDAGLARKLKTTETKNTYSKKFRVYDALGLVGHETASSSITIQNYDSDGYESTKTYTAVYSTAYTVTWNDETVDIRSGTRNCRPGETCVYKSWFLFDLSFCTVDGAAVLLEILLNEYYEEEPFREDYEIKYWGLYDGQVIELTNLFNETDTGYPFEYRNDNEGYGQLHDNIFIKGNPVVWGGSFHIGFINHIFYMALQRPKANP